MRYLVLNYVLYLAFVAPGFQRTSFSEKAQVLEFIAQDVSLRARVFLSTESLLVDFPVQQRGFLFKTDSYVYLNRSEKTYTVHSYASLLSNASTTMNSDAPRSQSASFELSAAGFETTGETDVIAGFRASKLVRISQGKLRTEIWVSEEIIPNALQAVGRKMRTILPRNHWNDDHPTPSLIQAVLVFGLPLKISDHVSQSELRAVAADSENTAVDLFRIPPEYRPKYP